MKIENNGGYSIRLIYGTLTGARVEKILKPGEYTFLELRPTPSYTDTLVVTRE